MPDDLSANSDYGLEKFQKLFDRGLDFALDRLLQRAEAQGENFRLPIFVKSCTALKRNLAKIRQNSFKTRGANAPSPSKGCVGTMNAAIHSSA